MSSTSNTNQGSGSEESDAPVSGPYAGTINHEDFPALERILVVPRSIGNIRASSIVGTWVDAAQSVIDSMERQTQSEIVDDIQDRSNEPIISKGYAGLQFRYGEPYDITHSGPVVFLSHQETDEDQAAMISDLLRNAVQGARGVITIGGGESVDRSDSLWQKGEGQSLDIGFAAQIGNLDGADSVKFLPFSVLEKILAWVVEDIFKFSGLSPMPTLIYQMPGKVMDTLRALEPLDGCKLIRLVTSPVPQLEVEGPESGERVFRKAPIVTTSLTEADPPRYRSLRFALVGTDRGIMCQMDLETKSMVASLASSWRLVNALKAHSDWAIAGRCWIAGSMGWAISRTLQSAASRSEGPSSVIWELQEDEEWASPSAVQVKCGTDEVVVTPIDPSIGSATTKPVMVYRYSEQGLRGSLECMGADTGRALMTVFSRSQRQYVPALLSGINLYTFSGDEPVPVDAGLGYGDIMSILHVITPIVQGDRIFGWVSSDGEPSEMVWGSVPIFHAELGSSSAQVAPMYDADSSSTLLISLTSDGTRSESILYPSLIPMHKRLDMLRVVSAIGMSLNLQGAVFNVVVARLEPGVRAPALIRSGQARMIGRRSRVINTGGFEPFEILETEPDYNPIGAGIGHLRSLARVVAGSALVDRTGSREEVNTLRAEIERLRQVVVTRESFIAKVKDGYLQMQKEAETSEMRIGDLEVRNSELISICRGKEEQMLSMQGRLDESRAEMAKAREGLLQAAQREKDNETERAQARQQMELMRRELEEAELRIRASMTLSAGEVMHTGPSSAPMVGESGQRQITFGDISIDFGLFDSLDPCCGEDDDEEQPDEAVGEMLDGPLALQSEAVIRQRAKDTGTDYEALCVRAVNEFLASRPDHDVPDDVYIQTLVKSGTMYSHIASVWQRSKTV